MSNEKELLNLLRPSLKEAKTKKEKGQNSIKPTVAENSEQDQEPVSATIEK